MFGHITLLRRSEFEVDRAQVGWPSYMARMTLSE